MKLATSAASASVTWMGTQYQSTLTRAQTGGLFGIFESRVPAGEGPPVHVHHNEDEVLHVLEGQYEFWLDGTVSRGGPGTSMFLPRRVPHTFRVVGGQPGRNLAIVTPGGFEAFFAEVASRNLRIPENMPELVETGSRFGLEFRGPAPWA